MHGSCKIALYMVLLIDVDGDILLLPVRVIPCLKCTNLVVNTRVYSSVTNSIQSNYICQRYLRCFLAVHVCSGEIHVYDLRKFNLKTYREKPEVYIMIPSLVSEGQVIR